MYHREFRQLLSHTKAYYGKSVHATRLILGKHLVVHAVLSNRAVPTVSVRQELSDSQRMTESEPGIQVPHQIQCAVHGITVHCASCPLSTQQCQPLLPSLLSSTSQVEGTLQHLEAPARGPNWFTEIFVGPGWPSVAGFKVTKSRLFNSSNVQVAFTPQLLNAFQFFD